MLFAVGWIAKSLGRRGETIWELQCQDQWLQCVHVSVAGFEISNNNYCHLKDTLGTSGVRNSNHSAILPPRIVIKLMWSFDMSCLFCRTITRDDLVEYISKHYSAPRMVLAAAGGKQSWYVQLFTIAPLQLLGNCQQNQYHSINMFIKI